ncbi:MAG: ATP-dependent RNA helicase HrpA [Actinobacteria bacterium]|nr:ATP-dependent RNA helicase HrpA [Actinomycetota bacterium]
MPADDPTAPDAVAEVSAAELRNRLDAVMLRDRRRLGRRLEGTRKIRDAAKRAHALRRIADDVDRAEKRLQARRASLPEITYPDLPVSARRDDIAAAIRDHQVIVVAGETGSGKTTQLPKILLELGRGVVGQIGHTQPRRIAARAVADRVAEELGVEVGDVVGYQVRFTDHSSDRTLVKVMTDGILLAEIQDDRLLERYDTIIIDEAHERSLTIDFLLGYLKEILPRRPDLKVVVTSATIDTARFSEHFASEHGVAAPVVEVSGRTYPVDVVYEPYGVEDGDDRDQTQAICDAVQVLQGQGPGDVLVFLSGEREIRDTEDALRGLKLRDTDILPLYARLSAAEQHRVFEPHAGRRVVLATNVAETSLTVPGIRYVVDPGTARISRYSARLKVQRLPIEPISQASANQRSGRCGRVADGIAIRLYSEDDFLARPEFTEPEILRTNLASVILQMTALGLGDVERFPFVEPPDSRQVRDGVDLLRELGALKPGKDLQLTEIGRRLARLPLDPRLGRMVIEAEKQDCVAEVLVVVSALSIQDPRERPADKQAQADQLHARFTDPTSDFLAYLGMWTYLREQQRERSGNAFRRMCRDEYLHYLRVREWQDVHSQLRQACKDLGIEVGRLRDGEGAADPAAVHRALVAGLLSHVGSYDQSRRDYLGARGARWAIHPGSSLSRKPPAFAVAAELVETSRLFGRVVARVDPEAVEQVAGDLVARTYSEPRWSKRRGAVVADERVTLYGVPLVVGRRVQYGRIDPVASRELFVRHALVQGEWDSHHRFVRDNARTLAEVAELEDRVRRRDLLVEDDVLVEFFEQRVPEGVHDTRTFDRWWRDARKRTPDLLTIPRELLLRGDDDVDDEFPRTWSFGSFDVELPLSYAFEPGAANDGVTVDLPVALLPQVHADDFLWQVPGRREEVVTALIRGLPKNLRTSFVPVPDTARAVLDGLEPGEHGLLDSLGRALTRRTGVVVPYDAWAPESLPDHLRVTVRVVDEAGAVLAAGKDVAALQKELAPAVQETISHASRSLERLGLMEFPPEGVPTSVEEQHGEHVVTGWPALVDRGDRVDLRVLVGPTEQAVEHRKGVRRLLRLQTTTPSRYVVGVLEMREKIALGHTPHGSVPALIDDAMGACLDAGAARAASGDPDGFHDGLPFTRAAYDRALAAAQDRLGDELLRVVRQAAQVLELATEVRTRLPQVSSPKLASMRADLGLQVDELLPDGFITRAGVERMPDLVRYLRAAVRRLDTAPEDTGRDAQRQAQVEAVLAERDDAFAALPPARRESLPAQEIRWMIEELRVNLFAQNLGTRYPISEKRIHKALDALFDG